MVYLTAVGSFCLQFLACSQFFFCALLLQCILIIKERKKN